jgi:prophage regulatory protein
MPQVKNCTGLSRTGIYDRIARGAFPSPISLGTRAVGWLESEVEAWIAHRAAVSRENDSAQKETSWKETTLTPTEKARLRANTAA